MDITFQPSRFSHRIFGVFIDGKPVGIVRKTGHVLWRARVSVPNMIGIGVGYGLTPRAAVEAAWKKVTQ
jgi:hypothetical protein